MTWPKWLSFGIGFVFLGVLSSNFGGGTALPFLVVLYLVPTFVAGFRHKLNPGGVLVVNLFLGWTIIGWIVALAMAASGATQKRQAI